MRFLGLSIENFGVFRGKHSFELAPRFQNGQMQHLTIFSGHNGAGKTTIFQGMMLALHGSASFGYGLSPQKYNNFLLSRMHRLPHKMKHLSTADADSGVALKLQYV